MTWMNFKRFKMMRTLPLVFLLSVSVGAYSQEDVTVWLTNPDRSALFARQATPIALAAGQAGAGAATTSTTSVIEVDEKKSYQTMAGFGFALTGGSAELMMHMDAGSRAALEHKLFGESGDGIGVSYLRVTIGASDMNEHVFSYDDLPEGETDARMAKFDLGPDRADVIPVLKEILAINPGIKIMASPWSAPLWMKTTGNAKGGVLKPKYFGVYAAYFVKYIERMKAEGIPIEAVTVQNEPLNENNTPSMLMLESEEAEFIKTDLGPAFAKAGIRTKIWLYDHNLDHPMYPLSILRDPAAAKYVDGTAFHLYGGTVDAMTEVHDAFPKKHLYFTEQTLNDRNDGAVMNLSKPVAQILIGVTRNWGENVVLWNLAADPNNGPHTNNGGCGGCIGAVTIDGSKSTLRVAYYSLAHFSKLVRPGAVRIGANTLDALPNVAFRTPEGKRVLVVANVTESPQRFKVRSGGKEFLATLDGGSVGTYLW